MILGGKITTGTFLLVSALASCELVDLVEQNTGPGQTGTVRVTITGLSDAATEAGTISGDLAIALSAPSAGTSTGESDEVLMGTYDVTYAPPELHRLTAADVGMETKQAMVADGTAFDLGWGVELAPVVDAVDVSPNVVNLAPGDMQQLTATPRDAAGDAITGLSISWSTSNAPVATVDDSGNVAAVANGDAVITATASGVSGTATVQVVSGSVTDTLRAVPLTAMAGITYMGFDGGLYPGGNTVPQAHTTAGLAAAGAVEPLDANGVASADGKYVLVSIGMSNTTQEFCSANSLSPCNSWTFVGQALVDAAVDDTSLEIVNGAFSGQAASAWESTTSGNYDRIRDAHLVPRGLTEAQVQIAWVKNANPSPSRSLPDASADAFALQQSLGNIVRTLKVRYPNLKLVFLSSRIYAGYARSNLNPEPYAYESGFSAKWLIEAQIDQMANGGVVVDQRGGDLDYNTVAPWIGWGPYLWADGTTPNPDGISWLPGDFESDGTHPARSAEEKVGTALLEFFKTSQFTLGWFLK